MPHTQTLKNVVIIVTVRTAISLQILAMETKHLSVLGHDFLSTLYEKKKEIK